MIAISEKALDQALAWLSALRRFIDALPAEEQRSVKSKLAYHATAPLDPLDFVEEVLACCEPVSLLGEDD